MNDILSGAQDSVLQELTKKPRYLTNRYRGFNPTNDFQIQFEVRPNFYMRKLLSILFRFIIFIRLEIC